ncbi:MAG: gamma-glutamyltransferase [Candidatus Nanopelagicales bacterium]
MNPAVAAGAPGTVGVALDVLRRGGNAVDAAVAAAFAMPVTEPGLASLGGGGFMMVRDRDGETTLIDFFAAVPTPRSGHLHRVVTVEFAGARQNFAIGSSTVAVPGVLPGLLHAHERFGRLKRDAVVTPAIEVAREGAAMTGEQALVLQLIGGVLTSTTESARVYAPKGQLLRAGQILRNRNYADFLDEVIGGLDRLPAIGPLHEDDLAAYEVYEREPLRVALPGATLLTNPPPSLGGSIIAHALSDLAAIESPTALDLLTALRRATEHNKTLAPVSVRGTTHISVTDGEQTVAMTVSNGSCSGVMLPGTGIQLNNMMGESDLHPDGHTLPVGARIRSMMAPSIVERKGLVTALGTGGSERIRSAMVRVIAQLARDVDLQEAIDAPRVHLDNDDVVQVEPGFPAEQVAALPSPMSLWDARDFYFGGVHAVSSDGTAACDARRGGHIGTL